MFIVSFLLKPILKKMFMVEKKMARESSKSIGQEESNGAKDRMIKLNHLLDGCIE